MVDGLRAEGITVTLVGLSKFESFLGPVLPARVFISPAGGGADVLFLDRPLGAIGVCQSQKDDGFWAAVVTLGGRVAARAEGSQHPLYSVSDRFFIQAFGDRFDTAIRKVLGTARPPCDQSAGDAGK